MSVDGDQLLFRKMDELMRVPLAGGAPVTLSAAPSMTLQFDSDPTMWLAATSL